MSVTESCGNVFKDLGFEEREANRLFRNAVLESAAKAASMVFGGKSHKVSENSDTYAIQDHAVEQCVAAIRALMRPK